MFKNQQLPCSQVLLVLVRMILHREPSILHLAAGQDRDAYRGKRWGETLQCLFSMEFIELTMPIYAPVSAPNLRSLPVCILPFDKVQQFCSNSAALLMFK